MCSVRKMAMENKYTPHQGKRECERRVVQGHAGIKAMATLVRKHCKDAMKPKVDGSGETNADALARWLS